jgi:hypothetical protein
VRFSRSVGLPASYPDILGLALRIPTERPTHVTVGIDRQERPRPLIARSLAVGRSALNRCSTPGDLLWLAVTV